MNLPPKIAKANPAWAQLPGIGHYQINPTPNMIFMFCQPRDPVHMAALLPGRSNIGGNNLNDEKQQAFKYFHSDSR